MKANESKINTSKKAMEIGIYTFGDVIKNKQTGERRNSHQRIKEIIEAAKLADEAGLDIFGIGEHHSNDFAVSAPAIVLAAIAQQTKQIRLTTATTVLSTNDPVRIYEDFATLDLISDGRAEILAGRGAFIESFPLFGYDLNDYNELFAEKIELLLKLNENKPITWHGKFRSSLDRVELTPHPMQDKLPIWIGVGGTPESARRAGQFGTGMALAILSGNGDRFKPLVDVYRKAGTLAGHDLEQLKVGVTTHAYIATTSQQAKEEFYPSYANYFGYLMKLMHGIESNITRNDFEELSRQLCIGSPQQIIEKILYQYELFGHQRFIAQMDIGNMPYRQVVKAIELLATEVAPVIRRETSK
ncbi:LLM class flavin-dependent oxidoreductase [Ectobacillus polymachus]|uniref:LLM class flavin-dependent oxidoreductase n=1 Tax=Ectobacillus polymachus TaxID=1508806 RepID=UPI003A85FAB1